VITESLRENPLAVNSHGDFFVSVLFLVADVGLSLYLKDMAKTKTNKLTKTQTKAIAELTQVLTDSNMATSFKVVASKKSAIVNLFDAAGKMVWGSFYTVGRRGAVAHKGGC
jgi:hypothetical protein